MEFCDEKDYENIFFLDNLEILNILDNLGSGILEVKNIIKGIFFKVKVELLVKEVDVLKVGGKLNYIKN